MEIIFATGNKNKLREAQEILGKHYTLKTPADYGILEDIPETSDTLEGNASIKSHYIWERLSLPCFADDTGLEVNALNGEPGVKSARYAGEGKDSKDNMEKLLKNLEGKDDRSAQFRCCISLIIDGKEHIFNGKCEGEITTECSGKGGFGYDPIFKPNGFDKSFSEIPAEEKNSISHRGYALEQLKEWFLQNK